MTKSKKTVLHVTSRDLFGKKSKQLRQKGLIPANVYGLQEESEKIELLLSSFNRVIAEQGDTTLLYLQVGSDKEIPTLISEIQYNPITGTPTHVAFKRVNLNVKVTAEIPVETVGTAEIAGATIVLTRNVLEVEALPADLPEVFEVDISSLTQVGQTLHLSDVSYDREKVKVMLSEEELEAPIVLVQEVKEEVVETPAETPEGAADATTPAVEGESAASEEKKE
jgi:large subunit ribosomal protein L25